jgi:vacuolar-type H+-ATPase subunit H
MKTEKRQSSPLAEQAMQQVLQAERDAEKVIAECELAASQIINDAKSRVQRIESRIDQRITNMEMRHEHKLDRLITSIEAEAEEVLKRTAEQHADSNSLQPVINKLAISLCLGDVTDVETGKET